MNETNHYKKLPDGTWGALVKDRPKPGDAVTLHKRDGSTSTEVVDRVVSEEPNGFICSLWKKKAASSRGGSCDECGTHHNTLVGCRDSSGIPGRCCPRCARMSPMERSFA